MEPQRVWNPPNPYLTEHRELLGEAPPVELEVYEDHAQSILSENDSPDIGFRWSVNPYRGCFHACAYCLYGDTLVLMGDGTTKRLKDIEVDEQVYGTVGRGDYRRYVRTRVLAQWSTVKYAYRVLLEDGTELVASGDHRFLTNRGWKYVTGVQQGRDRRPHLTPNVKLMGTGRFAQWQGGAWDYRRGYLCGIIRGDGLLGSYEYIGRRRDREVVHQFRLALIDSEALHRARQYLLDFEISTVQCGFKRPDGCQPMQMIRTSARSQVERVRDLIRWPLAPSLEWSKGFLAGIFDAEGSYSRGVLRIANTSGEIIDHTACLLRCLGFDPVVDGYATRSVKYVRLRGGLSEALRFFHLTEPAIGRKRDIEGQSLKNDAPLGVVEVQPLGFELPMFDITTGTGDFIANGVVSHNCYARPTHEYYGLGAGTDFERKIFVKRNAPELLESAFRRKSWRGELVVFSGVTDCYQPLEAAWQLTRRCLEVCLKYRNPVAIITKSLLPRRDAALLAALHREASARVSFSIPFRDEAVARAIEPGAPTPRKRFETMRLLAEAGVPVGIGVAPVIPGLNDSDIPELLREAKRCGASDAFHVLLRLPGSVKTVFFHRLEQQLPGRLKKVEHKIRDSRGGALYDSRFGKRFEGKGEHWDVIERVWRVWIRRTGFDRGDDEPAQERPSTFRRPAAGGQAEFGWAG